MGAVTREQDQTMSTWTVGEVARELGFTVPTLHHYDEIGLVVPSERSAAGYRLYTEPDLERLQHVVVYRRLELSLEQIRRTLDEIEPWWEGVEVCLFDAREPLPLQAPWGDDASGLNVFVLDAKHAITSWWDPGHGSPANAVLTKHLDVPVTCRGLRTMHRVHARLLSLSISDSAAEDEYF